jgi:hypothetical protein
MPYAALRPDGYTVKDPSAADLARIAREVSPPAFVVLDYRLDTLAPLGEFRNLQSLKIQSGSKLRDLDPVAALTSLRELVLATPPGSDGSGRVIDVASYQPLVSLAALERLVLIAVRPRDLSLSPIERMTHLRDLDISGVPEFTLEHYARLAVALPQTAGRCLQPYIQIKGVGFCRKCKGPQVLLNGAPPRARKWICPACQEKQLAAHVERWEAAKRDRRGIQA